MQNAYCRGPLSICLSPMYHARCLDNALKPVLPVTWQSDSLSPVKYAEPPTLPLIKIGICVLTIFLLHLPRQPSKSCCCTRRILFWAQGPADVLNLNCAVPVHLLLIHVLIPAECSGASDRWESMEEQGKLATIWAGRLTSRVTLSTLSLIAQARTCHAAPPWSASPWQAPSSRLLPAPPKGRPTCRLSASPRRTICSERNSVLPALMEAIVQFHFTL